MGFVLDPFQPVFMQRALVEVLVLAIPAGLLGTWVVTRRLAFVTHAIGHATFPALVIAALAGWSLTGTSLVSAVLIGLLLVWLARQPTLNQGVAVAIVLSAGLALGAVLVSDITDPGVRANALLFGSLLAIDWTDVIHSAVAALLAVGLTLTCGRQLAAGTFQRDLAVAEGQRGTALDALLMVLLAGTVAVAAQAVGSLLVASLLVVPSATARLITNRVTSMHVTGMVLAAVESVAGLWVAFHLNAPPGAGIAVVAAGAFVIVAAMRALVVARRRQMVAIPT